MQKENKSDNHDPASDSPEQSYILPGICIGMILGMLLGFAMGSLVLHNIILGLCTGQYACEISVQSAEKFDCASYAQTLCGVA